MGKLSLEQFSNISNSEATSNDLGNGIVIKEESPTQEYPLSIETINKSSAVAILSSPAEVVSAYLDELPISEDLPLPSRIADSNDIFQSGDYPFNGGKVSGIPSYEWPMDNEEDLWNNLDLEWMSKTELTLEEQPVTTEQLLYRPKLYEKSVSILISAMGNDTFVQGPQSLDRTLEVGSLKITQYQLPFLLGSLVGFCLLVILATSLVLYICFRKRHASEQYNIKSEESSVTSSKTCPSSHHISRDSLIVVGADSNSYQARLYPELSPVPNSVFDLKFDFYFNPPKTEENCEVIKPSKSFSSVDVELGDETSIKETILKNQCSNPHNSKLMDNEIERRYSTTFGEMRETVEDDKPLRKGHSLKEITHQNNNTERKHPYREYSKSICSKGKRFSERNNPQRKFENMKINSNPAWIGSKQSETDKKLMLMINDKSDNKLHSKRMGSDAAKVIALSKSVTQLMQKADISSEDSYNRKHYYNCDENEAILNNNVVIIYNERTAL